MIMNAKTNHIFQGDFLSGVRSIFLKTLDLGVLLRLLWLLILLRLIIFLAETERDLDLNLSFSFISIRTCRGVLFSLSSLPLKALVKLIPSCRRGCLKASSQLILSYSLFFKHRLIKSFDLSDTDGSITIDLVLIPLISCSSLVAGQGVKPWIIS